MFKLLSKESNIFSIPVYIGFLLFIVISFNIFNFNSLHVFSAVVTFLGVSLGYFLFNKINLTYQSHLPLFLYTFFVFGLYPGFLDIGISISLLTNSFILLMLSDNQNVSKNASYMMIGALLAINFIFLPTTFPLVVFVILHIISTAERIVLQIFRLIFGMVLIGVSYFSIAFILQWDSWDAAYLPQIIWEPQKDLYPLGYLFPVIAMLIFSVIDHFRTFNRKSPTIKYKYSFLLLFTISQLITIILFMGKSHQYLLLMAFPSSIMISRMLRFLPKYWMQEISLWIGIISMILFKISNYFELFH